MTAQTVLRMFATASGAVDLVSREVASWYRGLFCHSLVHFSTSGSRAPESHVLSDSREGFPMLRSKSFCRDLPSRSGEGGMSGFRGCPQLLVLIMVRVNKARWIASNFVYQDLTPEECTLHCREGLSS